ncbi:MAG: OmpA family protein [Chitinophagales bacterium]
MRISKITFVLLTFLFFTSVSSYAQTQEEIERLLNGGSSTEETTTTTKEKKEKAPKEKKEKEPKQKEEKVKEEKVKEPKEKKEKEVKAKEEKAPKQKTTSTKSSSASSSKSSSSSRTRPSATADKPLRTWSIGVFGGLTNPVTDIRYKDWFGTIDPRNENQWNAGLRVTKMFDAAFGLQWQGSYNVVQGVFDNNVQYKEDREYMVNRGFTEGVYFKSNVISTSLQVYWNISNTVFGPNRYYNAKLKGREMKPRRFSLYAYSGIGATWFDPHVMMSADKRPIDLAGVDIVNKNQTKTIMEMYMPFALGAKFKLAKAVDLSVEYVMNYVFTDKLDGYIYDHPGRIKNDMYSNINVGLDFKLGTKKKSKEHVEWVNPMDKVYTDLDKIDAIDKKVKRLTTDADEDGVSDYFDKDTETEEGVTVDGSGRAIDSDGDGVPDRADLEPFSDKGATVDEFGVAVDSDGDGVPDSRDLEIDSPDGAFVNFQGVAIDGKVKPATARGEFFPSIFFDTDKANIKREYEDELFMVAKNIIAMEGVQFLLTGHCDERGSDEYNIELGQRRADAVKQYLVENYSIDASRIQTLSKGKSEIESPRFNVNRRVDVMIIEK